MPRLKDRRSAAARFGRSIGVALLTLIAAVAVGLASTVSSAISLLATMVLAMTGTFTSTPYPAYLDMVENQYVVPTLQHDGKVYGPYVGITTPEQAWPITGLFDYTFGTSVRLGVNDLEKALAKQQAENPNEPLLIFGYSQSSVISIIERRKLDEYYTQHPELPVSNIELINFSFNGAASADTLFPTTMVTNRWDGFADSPLYPLWLPSTINGVLGMLYGHTEYDEWDLADGDYWVGKDGNTDYYFLPNEKLPLLGPARSLGVPEEVIDIFEPFFTEVVELGYNRSIPPWGPTPARLIPRIDPFTAIPKLIGAINEGIDNAFELIGSPPPLRVPAPQTPPAPTSASAPEPTEKSAEPPVAPPAEATAPEQEPATETKTPPVPEEPTEAQDAEEPELVTPTTKPKPSSQSLRPTVRDPIGAFGPRVRDLLHRGHEAIERATKPRPKAPAVATPAGNDTDSTGDDTSGGTDGS